MADGKGSRLTPIEANENKKRTEPSLAAQIMQQNCKQFKPHYLFVAMFDLD